MKNCKIVRGKNVKIEKSVKILGNCKIGDGCKILGCTKLVDCVIEAGSVVENSVVVGSRIGKCCIVGPFANVRAGCEIGENCKIGAFVELKSALLGSGCKVAHLAYVGNAVLGARVNVGCGVVFANFDGAKKHRSIVGDDVFIGCNCNIVAPVKIANKCFIAAGTTVTENTQEADFVIGRVRQENKKRKKIEENSQKNA